MQQYALFYDEKSQRLHIQQDDNATSICGKADNYGLPIGWNLTNPRSSVLCAGCVQKILEQKDSEVASIRNTPKGILKTRNETVERHLERLEAEVNQLKDTLRFIHDMVYEDLRVDESGSSTWQIEAECAKALNLTDVERDIDTYIINQALSELQRHVLVDVLYFNLNYYGRNSIKLLEFSFQSVAEIDTLKHNGLIRTIRTDTITYISLTQKGYDLAKTLSADSIVQPRFGMIKVCPDCNEALHKQEDGSLQCLECGRTFEGQSS